MNLKLFSIVLLLNFLQASGILNAQTRSSIHSYSANSIDGVLIDFKQFDGKRILIVNTASKCGLTPQFKELEELHEEYKDKGLVIIGFPSNDFAQQDPGSNQEIESFCTKNYGVQFLMMEKIHVKGDSIHPVYAWLTQKAQNGSLSSKVKWNFQKFLINEKGELDAVVSPWRKPTCRRIIRWIQKHHSSV